MATTTEDTTLIGQALAYVIELYHELTSENGAPTLGTQNQIVDFILADRSCAKRSRSGVRRSRLTKRGLERQSAYPIMQPIVESGTLQNPL